MKVNLCFLNPVIPWTGRALILMLFNEPSKLKKNKLNGVVFELMLIYSLQIKCNFNYYLA